MKVSIITPTIRNEKLNIVKNAITNQSFKDFEWLIVSPVNPNIDEAIWIEDDFKGGFYGLNRAYNRLFKEAKGDIIISIQDSIWAPPDAVQKFVENVESVNAIVSGVGDQYAQEGQFGKPEIKIWNDPRKGNDNGSFYECFPNDIEWNFCALPKKAVFDVGGMDEEFDFLGFDGGQLQINKRMDALGWKTYLDQDNESFTVRHSRASYGGQKTWDDNHTLFNGAYDKRNKELVKSGTWPRLNFLKED